MEMRGHVLKELHEMLNHHHKTIGEGIHKLVHDIMCIGMW